MHKVRKPFRQCLPPSELARDPSENPIAMLAGVTASWMLTTAWIGTIPPCCAAVPGIRGTLSTPSLLQPSGAAWAHLRRPSSTHTRAGPALLALRKPEPPPPASDQPEMPQTVVFAVAFLMSACFGVIAQVLRTACAPHVCIALGAHCMRTACALHAHCMPTTGAAGRADAQRLLSQGGDDARHARLRLGPGRGHALQLLW